MSNIVGNDISEFQGEIDWPTYKDNSNFVFMKASEGTGKIDNWFGNNRQKARELGLPRGFYHFVHPDLGNTPQAEAEYFEALIDGDPLQEGEVLALDYEVSYSDPVTWCKEFLDHVSSHYNGIKPLVYLNQQLVGDFDWSPVVAAGYGLWIAAYTGDPNNNNAHIGAWPFAAMQQWTDRQTVPGINGVVDGDVFFGDAEQFKAYGYKKPQEEVATQPVEPANPTPPVNEEPSSVSGDVVGTPVEPQQPQEPTTPPAPTQPIVENAPVNTPPTIPDATAPEHVNFFEQLIAWIESTFQKKNE